MLNKPHVFERNLIEHMLNVNQEDDQDIQSIKKIINIEQRIVINNLQHVVRN